MCALMSLMPPVMLLVIFLAPKCEGRRCPRQFLFWRAMACTLLYLSIGLFHPQNFLIYITGFFILMLVQERSLKPHIRYKVSRKLGWQTVNKVLPSQHVMRSHARKELCPSKFCRSLACSLTAHSGRHKWRACPQATQLVIQSSNPTSAWRVQTGGAVLPKIRSKF